MWRTDSLEKILMLGKIEGRRKIRWQMMRWLDGITDLMDMSLSKLWSWLWTRKPGVLQSMGLQRVRHNLVTKPLPPSVDIDTEISSVQPLSHVQLFETPWTAARQASLSIINSRSSFPLSRWCHPAISSSLCPSPRTFNLSQHQGLFQWVSSSH